MSRLKVGDRVSIRHPQITGARKRSPAYSYGTVVDRPADAPHPPLHGGFRYVLVDGHAKPELAYVGKLAKLDGRPS